MAKKKDEKDVLVVRDEKTGEISVVAGLNADDTPKRTPAKAENAQSFLQFDRHGDVLDNFFKNFFRQCKEPSRFGFYRIAADQVDSMLGVMKDLLQHPYQNKQILAPHKIDTFPYQQQVQEEMAAQKTEKQEPQKQENMEQQKEQQESPQQTQGRQGYQPINESKINWQELEDRWGVKRDDLEKSGDLTKMLHYGKSGEVPEAIRKGEAAAKKNMHKVALKGTTIPHEIVGKYGAGAVLLKPAAPGTGMIAGGPVRAVIEAAGIKDIRAKSMRSNNPINVVSATFAGLCGLVSAESVAEKRGKTVKEILG